MLFWGGRDGGHWNIPVGALGISLGYFLIAYLENRFSREGVLVCFFQRYVGKVK